MKHQLLKFGILKSREVHISTVESGLNCNCICPCCKTKLVAKKGQLGKPQEHFAHVSNEQCEFAYETSIHFEAKRILEHEKRIALPCRKLFNNTEFRKFFQPDNGEKIGTIENKIFELADIKSEKRLHDFVPDIQATIQGRPILIEIAVTSKVKASKKEKMESVGIPTLEIDFSHLPRDISEEDFRLNLFHNSKNKIWIYNPKEDDLNEKFTLLRSKIEKLIRPYLDSFQIKRVGKARSICSCPSPFNKNRIVRIDECRTCIFCVSIFENNVVCAAKNYLQIKGIFDGEIMQANFN